MQKPISKVEIPYYEAVLRAAQARVDIPLARAKELALDAVWLATVDAEAVLKELT